jgi:Ca-activated chloride channel homolog
MRISLTCAGILSLPLLFVVPGVFVQTHKNAAASSIATESVVFAASDASGNPVPTLSPDSLEMHLDGKIVRADSVQPLKGEPLVFPMLVDVSGSSRRFADKEAACVPQLFRELASDDGKGYLVVFRDRLASANRFVNSETVDDTLKHFPSESRRGGTALYDALFYAITRQLNSSQLPSTPRRAIFLFSDGGDNLSRRDQGAVIKAAQTEQIAIFSIGFSRSSISDAMTPEEAEAPESLTALGRQTGGLVVFLDDHNDPIERVIHLVNQQYLLSFDRPLLKAGKLYGLKINTRDNAAHISAPTKWFLH